MGFRFRKSINLGSGAWLNISKRGLSSLSFGRRGSVLNIGRHGVRETVGLPGTGLSYTTDRSSGLVARIFSVVGTVGVMVFALITGLFRWLWRT